MINYAVYEQATGRILKTGVCAETDLDLQLTGTKGCSVVKSSADDTLHYIRNGVREVRPEMNPSLSGATLSALPVGCSVYVDGEQVVDVLEGSVITFEKKQETDTYKVLVSLFPYLDYEVVL